jgi:type IV pilus assembly protein PilW
MEKEMKVQSMFNKKGITLIELLVALVISAMVMAGVYRIFISQSKAYTVQDQVVEVQQNVRGTMEVLLRDLRMTGFDDDNLNSIYTGGALSGKPIRVVTPIATPPNDHSITVTYEYFDRTVLPSGQYQLHTVAYTLDGSSNLVRTRTVTRPNGSTQTEPQETLLPNVTALNFTYGFDDNDDDVLDRWASFGVGRVIAVRVVLTARPNHPDVQKAVSPRTLDSIVMMRNLCLR